MKNTIDLAVTASGCSKKVTSIIYRVLNTTVLYAVNRLPSVFMLPGIGNIAFYEGIRITPLLISGGVIL